MDSAAIRPIHFRHGLLPLRHGVMAAGALLALSASPGALAQGISYTNMFLNVGFTQTANGNNLVDDGAFFSTSAVADGSIPFSDASVSYPGPASPLSLTTSDGTNFGFQSYAYASKAAMDADFPQGDYVFTLQPVDTTQPPSTATLTLAADHYAPSGAPYLTGNSYSALQGMNAAQPITLSVSAFQTDNAAVASFVFLTVYDYTSSQWAYISPAMNASTTSLMLPANTLMAGHNYGYELDYSTRITPDSSGGDFASQIGYEMRTNGQFATAAAVPEPAVWLMLACGMGLLAWRKGADRRGAESVPR